MNYLAVSGVIAHLSPITGADRIQLAVVDCAEAGTWSGVVGIDMQPESAVTVFLQDAVLPPDPRWAFMEKSRWRVRMARFKGVPSECVIVAGTPGVAPGIDLAESLGVTKYTKPIPAAIAGDMQGSFPSFIPKTDETNFQAAWRSVEQMALDPWYAAEKADGTSCTVWNDEAGLHVCSRNWELKELTATGAVNAYWQATRKYGLDRLPMGVALQFEVVGPGIQGNPMGLLQLEARAFTLHDLSRHVDLPKGDLDAACALLGIPVARLICAGNTSRTHDELRQMAQIKYGNGKHGEGIVIRAFSSAWSFKAINLLYKD